MSEMENIQHRPLDAEKRNQLLWKIPGTPHIELPDGSKVHREQDTHSNYLVLFQRGTEVFRRWNYVLIEDSFYGPPGTLQSSQDLLGGKDPTCQEGDEIIQMAVATLNY